MNELRAKLDRSLCGGIRDGEDAAANAIARLDDLYVNACIVQRTCCGEAGGSGADHDDR